MKFANLARLLGILCVAAAGTSSGQASPEAGEQFICTSSAATRLISIYRKAPQGERKGGGCRVDYTKNGATRTLWSAAHDYPYCVKNALALVTKLSRDHFSCKPQTAEKSETSDPP